MSDHKHHIISLQTYIIVFAALLFCTFITILTARPDLVPLLGLERTFFDFGSFNIVLALLIASFKSSLVLLFFMHLYYDNKINLAFILSSVLFLALFIGLTMIDVNNRQDLYEIKGKLVNPHAPIYDSSSDNHSSH